MNWCSIVIKDAPQSRIKPILREVSISDGGKAETILTDASDPPCLGLELLF